MKRFLTCILSIVLMLSLISASLAESLPVYYQTGSILQENGADVQYLDESPFGEDEELLQIDIIGLVINDCILITCGGETMLLDGGEKRQLKEVENYFSVHGITCPDYFFMSHAHDDHCEGQMWLMKNGYTPKMVYTPYTEKDTKYQKWNSYLATLKERGIAWTTIDDGDELTLGGAGIKIYRWNDEHLTENHHSAAFMLRFGNASAFFGADLPNKSQQVILQSHDASEFKCDFYKTCHHAINATDPAFLKALDPAFAVITQGSAGTTAGDPQYKQYHIPCMHIQRTVHLATNGECWYVWTEQRYQ
ncbi:MAG: MBL fold metallo-hydrolase [Clostridia bacterium]|nr:MBL fold metallo-hydrolase [Clostridia bacterium]